MKKRILNLIIIYFICTLQVFSQYVSPEQAQFIGESFLANVRGESMQMNKNTVQTQATELSSVKVRAIGSNKQPAMYAVSQSNNWVLVAGDERVTPILAYTDEDGGEFPDDTNMPPAMLDLLEWYESQIEYLRENTSDNIIHPQWTQYKESATITAKSIIVNPLLVRNGIENQWGQSGNNLGSSTVKFYNKFCPAYHGDKENCTHSKAGCVAVATSQVMWYWQWPHAAVVKDDSGNSFVREYDWQLMPCTITNASSLEEVDMIANLLHDVGVAVNMKYGCEGSSAYTSDIPTTLKNIFNYNSDKVSKRSSHTNSKWLKLLKNELDNNRPILYDGDTYGGIGHQFVLDGYDSANAFHINYGWRGDCNGYYLLDSIGYDTLIFKYDQYAIFNVYPKYPSCSVIEIKPSASWQANFIVTNGGGITIKNRTIASNQKGVIYSGDYVKLTSGVHIKGGSEVHIAIKDMGCNKSANTAPQKSPTFLDDIDDRINSRNSQIQSFSISQIP